MLQSGLLMRLGFLLYGWIQDHSHVKFTDIDYVVFSDAAQYVALGQSPYLRDTYRYTPLLAFLLAPNTIFPMFGKILFCMVDLLTGYLLYLILRRRIDSKSAVLYSNLWTLNPFVAAISARGNAESLLCCMVVATIHLINTNRISLAAICYGISVHFKIYPIIYAVPLWFGVDSASGSATHRLTLFSWKRIQFGLLSAATFLLITYSFYLLYLSLI